jgi:hypothetical protein
MQTQSFTLTAVVLAALAPASAQQLSDQIAKLEKALASTVTGRPFSATEERHSLQILADGTRIESRQTDRMYRDADGRTRVEEPGGNVTLLDPRTGLSATLDPSAKLILNNKKAPITPLLADQQAADLKKTALLTRRKYTPAEILTPQMIGGVLATGTLTTTIIPAGAIGNDRPISIVTERWYSDELRIMVKSTNSDPRFGDTTYQVTDIVRGPQDPALFQIPSDYTNPTKELILDKFKLVGKVCVRNAASF